MARGSTADYSVTGGDVIAAALEEMNIVAIGGSPSAAQYAFMLKKLNYILKNIMGRNNSLYRGVKVWQRTTSTLTLASQALYSIYKSASADLNIYAPLNILSALVRNTDDEDYPLREMTREEYEAIPDKTVTGDPTRFCYEYLGGSTQSYGYLRLDYVPADTTDTIILTYHRPFYDLDAYTEDLDIAREWYLPILYLLITNTAPSFGVDPAPWMPLLAEARENANTFYPDRTDLYFQPGRDW